MKIKNTYTGFTRIIDIGRFAFFIEFNSTGVNIDLKELTQQASHFNRIVLSGGEPFEEREDIQKLIKSIFANNPQAKFEIHTNGTIHPLGIGKFKNIIYNVFVQLKNDGVLYTDRIKPDILNWLNDMNANFIFKIHNDDDVDEAFSIINDFEISKSQVFLMPSSEAINVSLKRAQYHGYNFTIPLGVDFNG